MWLSNEALFFQIYGLIVKRENGFISSADKFSTIEIHRRSDNPREASIIIANMDQDFAAKVTNTILAKISHVLEVIEVQ